MTHTKLSIMLSKCIVQMALPSLHNGKLMRVVLAKAYLHKWYLTYPVCVETGPIVWLLMATSSFLPLDVEYVLSIIYSGSLRSSAFTLELSFVITWLYHHCAPLVHLLPPQPPWICNLCSAKLIKNIDISAGSPLSLSLSLWDS